MTPVVRHLVRRLLPDAVRWRLTLWYSLALAAMLGAFAAGSLVVLRDVLVHRTQYFLGQSGELFANELRAASGTSPAGPRSDTAAIRATLAEVRFRDVRFLVYDAALQLVAESDTLPTAIVRRLFIPADLPFDRHALDERLAAERYAAPAAATIPDDEGGYQIAVRPVRLGAASYLIVAVQPGHPFYSTLTGMRTAYLVVIPIFLVIAGFVGNVLARRALAPIVAMSRQARTIGATNLHERLPVENPRDELGELAGMVNDLLARLEGAFAQQRRFVADASHELRTPVAIVRAEAEIALGRATRPAAEYRDALLVVEETGQRLSRLVDDLFLLARADAGHQAASREPLYLDELTATAARAMRALASQRSVRVELDLAPEAAFVGDPDLLDRLLLNLLDNAVKYAPPDTAVRVGLIRLTDAYRLTVADAGPGIPAEAQPHVFERFFRADKARSRGDHTTTSGAGLGLAIARWVTEAHGGALTLVRSGPTGSEFAAVLPIAPGEAGPSPNTSSSAALANAPTNAPTNAPVMSASSR